MSLRLSSVFALVLGLAVALAGSDAFAQARPSGGGSGPPSQGPTQSRPTRSKTVGPQRAPGDDDEPQGPSAAARPGGEPTADAPTDPLSIPEPVRNAIGTDHEAVPPPPEGPVERSYFPIFSKRQGDARVRLVPPLYLEHTRGLDPATGRETAATDTESLSALVYYRRRSATRDADILFPAVWRVRDESTHLFVLGPLAHREGPHEHDNWVAPLLFEGRRQDGGYLHVPPLLLTSRWSAKSAFTIAGPYFRTRTESDVDWGIAPFYFHGDNGDNDGARRTYTLIPPALYYHRERELDDSALTVVGPVIAERTAKRSIFDVAPLFFSIQGRPEASGVRESHVTLFPFFHYGTSPEKNLFIVPGYMRRVTPTSDTMLTPFVSFATTRRNATSLVVAGPIVPLFYRSVEHDVGARELAVLPFFYTASSPRGTSLLTPLFGRFENYNVSRKYWVFPTFTFASEIHGWTTNVHPLVYLNRSQDSSHTVFAPLYWDFSSPASRTTIGFPLYWRFADKSAGTVTQVAGNTLYRERRVSEGVDWEFHILPLFSYGRTPSGSWWNVLFGLAGYDRDGDTAKVRALYIPITVSGGK
jgi:hypothetical protein